jgi:hypothetical protein
MNHQSIVERVKRGLTFEPGLGAVVAWFVYLGASLGAITINAGSVSAQLPAFAPSVVLGGIAGFIWDVASSGTLSSVASVPAGKISGAAREGRCPTSR